MQPSLRLINYLSFIGSNHLRKITVGILISVVALSGFLYLNPLGLSWFNRGDKVEAAIQSVGPRTATASGDCVNTAGVGTIAWTSPGDAFSNNSTNATVSVDGTTSNYIKCTNFGFTTAMIPTGSTILGIIVGVERQSSGTGNGGSNDAAMRLVKGGTIGTTDRSTATTYTTSIVLEDHGSQSDLWGDTWSVSDVTASTFGAAFAATKGSGAGAAHTVSVDVIQITIYFNPPPPTLTQRNYIFEQDDGANVNANTSNGSANTALTNVRKGERIIARIQVDNTGTGSLDNGQFQLRFDHNDGSWSNVQPAAEIRPGYGLSGSNGDALTTNKAGTCTAGTTFTNGTWNEGTSVSRPINMITNKCTEVSFAIDTANATAGSTYRLSLYDLTNNSVLNTYTNYPTLTIVSDANDTVRFSKDDQPGLASCTDTSWGCDTVSSAANAGLHTNITFSPSGVPWIAYREGNVNVRVAKYVGSGGNCSNAAWSCSSVENNAAVTLIGNYAKLAFGPDGMAWLAYQETIGAASSMKVAKYVGSGGSGCAGGVTDWSCEAVDSIGSNTGQYTSIAFDPSGNPWVAYRDVTTGNLRLAKYVGSGGNCTSAAWNCSSIDTASSDGYSSLTFDQNGKAWIAFQDFTNLRLKVAEYVGSGGTCADTAWSCTVVDSSSASIGDDTSIAINSDNKPWIAYSDSTNTQVKLAKYVGTGGNCTSTAWDCAGVDSAGGQMDSIYLRIDGNGNKFMSYYNATTTTLQALRYVGAGGNCADLAWKCATVDSATANTGRYASLAIGPSGVPWIAYQDVTSAVLKVAKLPLPPFSNQLRYKLDGQGYTNAGTDDTGFDSLAASTNTPMYRFTTRHTTNTAAIQPTWIGKSDVAASTNNIKLQVFRFGSTNTWVDMATNTTCAANTDCTITPTAISTNLSEYYQVDGSKYLLHVRVYQVAGTTKTLQTDHYVASAGGGGPTPTPTPQMDQRLRGGNWWLNGIRQFMHLD